MPILERLVSIALGAFVATILCFLIAMSIAIIHVAWLFVQFVWTGAVS